MYLLDTSAVLAHFMDEPGAEEVENLLAQKPGWVALAAPSWAELDRRLHALIRDPAEVARVFSLYTHVLCTFVPLDKTAAQAAIQLQNACPNRLPLIDALIAGCAVAAERILVHRDEHLAQIPAGDLQTRQLPAKH